MVKNKDDKLRSRLFKQFKKIDNENIKHWTNKSAKLKVAHYTIRLYVILYVGTVVFLSTHNWFYKHGHTVQ